MTGINPNAMTAGTSTGVTITGSGFMAGAGVNFENGSSSTPTVSNVAVLDANTLTVTVSVKSDGPRSNRVWDVRVTNPDGASSLLTGGFTVIP